MSKRVFEKYHFQQADLQSFSIKPQYFHPQIFLLHALLCLCQLFMKYQESGSQDLSFVTCGLAVMFSVVQHQYFISLPLPWIGKHNKQSDDKTQALSSFINFLLYKALLRSILHLLFLHSFLLSSSFKLSAFVCIWHTKD